MTARRAVRVVSVALLLACLVGCRGNAQLPAIADGEMSHMGYEVEVRTVEEVPLAVAADRATPDQFSTRLMELLGEAYDSLDRAGVEEHGRNVFVYWNDADCSLFDSAEGLPVEAGVEVAVTFEGEGNVKRSATPAGTVATTAHFGPYEKLGEAHEAVMSWCAANGHESAGPFWEVYDHPSDDPARTRTDVFYLLK